MGRERKSRGQGKRIQVAWNSAFSPQKVQTQTNTCKIKYNASVYMGLFSLLLNNRLNCEPL